jgi:hypothetical protein
MSLRPSEKEKGNRPIMEKKTYTKAESERGGGHGYEWQGEEKEMGNKQQ